MRWVFRIVFAVIALVVLAVAMLFVLPAERIAALVTGQFEAATGRAMTLQGDVRPTLWPELGVATGPVTIANADWSDAGPMLQAQRLSIGVDMGALFGGNIRIRRVEADAPKILLEIAADGRGNWEITGGAGTTSESGGEAAAGKTGGLPVFTLDRAVITGGSVSFVDHATGSRTELNDIEATLRLPDFEGAAEIALAASMNGQAFSLSGGTAEFAAFLSDGAVAANADLTVGGSHIGFEGRAGLTPVAVGGRLDVDLADMGAVFALIGQAPPEIPRGFGQSIGLSGDVTVTKAGSATLRNGTIRLDQNELKGDADLMLTGRPRITARLSAGALDFSAAAGTGADGDAGGAAATAASGAAGWSRDAIDVSALRAADAEIALTAQSMNLGVAKLGPTSIVVRLDNGRLVTDLREVRAYDGAISGSVVVNGRGGLSARANLQAAGVALQPLLQELAGYDRLLASGDVSVNILGVGNDMQTLIDSLSGEGSVAIGGGELRGLDLVGMLRNLDTSYVGEGTKTIFDSITGSFKVEGGVLSNDDLRLVAPLLSATGAGKVGIGAQTLDYRAVPALLGDGTGGGLKVPLQITGPWADPKYRLDLEALATENLGDAATAAVKDAVASELGVTLDDTTTIQDAVKDELENRVGKGLLDLLGGN